LDEDWTSTGIADHVIWSTVTLFDVQRFNPVQKGQRIFGFVISIFIFLGVVGNAAGAENLPWYSSYAHAGSLLLVGFVAGFLLVRTVGIAALGATAGGVVGIVVALFNGAFAAAPGFLLIAVVGSIIQNLQRQRVLAGGGYI
jgi:hypothetical protein